MRQILLFVFCLQLILVLSGCCPCAFDGDKDKTPQEQQEVIEE